MLNNLLYLTASVIAIAVIVRISPTPASAVSLTVVLIALTAVVATLSDDPSDLARIIDAITDLVRGRADR